MKSEPLVFVGTCDLAGLVRGKGFPLEELPARMRKGVGLTPQQHHDVARSGRSTTRRSAPRAI